MGLQIANTAGYTKRSFTSSGIFMGYCLGNFTGPLLFKEADAPRYIPGWRATFGTTVAALTLVVVYRFFCLWENKRRDKSGVLEAYDHAFEDDVTDKKVCSFDVTILYDDAKIMYRIHNSDIRHRRSITLRMRLSTGCLARKRRYGEGFPKHRGMWYTGWQMKIALAL
jgi:hypothetical protein